MAARQSLLHCQPPKASVFHALQLDNPNSHLQRNSLNQRKWGCLIKAIEDSLALHPKPEQELESRGEAMDQVLCDELLQEVFTRLPPPSSRAVSLVSKRWLHLYRSSKTSLSLSLSLRLGGDVSAIIPHLLSQYPSLSSLSLLLPSRDASISDHLLVVVVSSPCSSKLTSLRFLAGAVRTSSLLSLSRTCTHLTSLTISLPRPLFFTWLADCRSLKELSIYVSISAAETPIAAQFVTEADDFELPLETLCLSGIRVNESGFCQLWRSCRNLRKLHLKSCEGLGDGGSYSSFTDSLPGLREVELRTCRAIVDGVLLKLAEHCELLTSVLVYDGGSRDGLLRFITSSRSNLERIDLRLPLDFKNDHLFALSLNFRTLSCLRLQSCCLVTGDGLKTFAIATSARLEELALINCDVVEREPGLLATLGQHLRQLRKLDLSYNEMLPDKELVSMLVSCNGLVDLRLRGCKGLSSALLVSISRNCNCLENIDIVHCCGVDSEAIESLLFNCPRLKRVQVEEVMVSDVARKHASMKFIEVVS